MKKHSVPNWGQSVLARAVGLEPANVAVSHEDDRNISYIQYQPYMEITVGKADGAVVASSITGASVNGREVCSRL